MKILNQLLLLLLLCIFGNVISSLLPFTFPGSICAMILLLILLLTKVLMPEHFAPSSTWFLQNMAFFFLPSNIQIIKHFKILSPVLVPVVLISIVSTITTFFVSAYVSIFTMYLCKKSLAKRMRPMNNFTATILPQIFDTPFFGICVCILFYSLGVFIRKKINALFLKITNLPFEKIESGSSVLQLFLSPITACLALSIYNQKEILKNNFLPLIAGTFSGALTSIVTVLALCKLFHIEETIVASILSKSVTTPIALALSQAKNGIQAITVLSVVATGITGGILAPKLVSLFRRKNGVALGIAIGTSSHAVGTASAIQMGEIYGAMSSVAIGCTGLATTIIFIFLK